MDAELIMLGTGSAFPRSSYNTCFVVRTPRLTWLTDAGGGNGVLARLDSCGIDVDSIGHMFISHSHTDHILGAVWIVRSVINRAIARGGELDTPFSIYGNTETLRALREICRLTLLDSHFRIMERVIGTHNVDTAPSVTLGDVTVSFFDCGSENVSQSGFRMTFASGRSLVCLGDESLTERNLPHVSGADMVMCGAFCSYADREIFKPYEKHHFTVKDVAMTAARAEIAGLLLYHCEDHTLPRRAERYRAEAAEHFPGAVIVPADGERISF